MKLSFAPWAPWRRLSSRMHLALGLAGLVVGVALSATWLGLVPDAEAVARQHRSSVAETMAVTVSALLDESQPQALQDTLAFIRSRNPDLLSIGLRDADGALLIDVGMHSMQWTMGAGEHSTDNELRVGIGQAGQPWGQLELRFEPLRNPAWPGWAAWMQDPGLRLSAFLFIACVPMFALYLRRMLQELDPSRAVPPRVRAAYDTLTEGLLVLDPRGRVVLANKSTALMLGVEESRLIGRSPSDFEWQDGHGAGLPREALPWATALASRQQQRDVHLHVASRDGMR